MQRSTFGSLSRRGSGAPNTDDAPQAPAGDGRPASTLKRLSGSLFGRSGAPQYRIVEDDGIVDDDFSDEFDGESTTGLERAPKRSAVQPSLSLNQPCRTPEPERKTDDSDFQPESPNTKKTKDAELNKIFNEVAELYNYDEWKDVPPDPIKTGRAVVQYEPESPGKGLKFFQHQKDTPPPLKAAKSRRDNRPLALRNKTPAGPSSLNPQPLGEPLPRKTSQQGRQASLQKSAPIIPGRPAAEKPAPLFAKKTVPEKPAPLFSKPSGPDKPAPLFSKQPALEKSAPLKPAPLSLGHPLPGKASSENLDELTPTPSPLLTSNKSKKKKVPRKPVATPEKESEENPTLAEFLREEKLNVAKQKENQSRGLVKKPLDEPNLPVTLPQIPDSYTPSYSGYQSGYKKVSEEEKGLRIPRSDVQMPPKRGRGNADVSQPEKSDKAEKPAPKKLQRSQKKKSDLYLEEDKDAWRRPESKLGTIDINKYFQNPQAWDCLKEEDKEEIRGLLPPSTPYDDKGRPAQEFLRYSNDWRNATRQFQEDLREGRYEPEWQDEAAQAVTERAAGEFDDFKEDQFEEYWGQKTKLNPREFSNAMAKVTLEEMIAAGKFEVGDIWCYIRTFGRGKSSFLVEKNVRIIGICSDNKLVFSIPPGQFKTGGPRPGLETVPESPLSSDPRSSTFPTAGTSATVDTTFHDPFHTHPGLEWKPSTAKGDDSSSWVTEDHESTILDTGDAHPGHPWQPLSKTQHEASAASSSSEGVTALPPIPSTASFTTSFITRTAAGLTSRQGSPARKAVPAAHSRNDSAGSATTPFPPRTSSRPGSTTSRQSESPTRPLSRSSNRAIKSEYPSSERPLSRTANRPFGPRPQFSRGNTPGHFRSPSAEAGGQTHTVDNLPALEKKILEIDGRTEQKKAVGGTEELWKCLRAKREMGPGRDVAGNDKDLGTLWEIRKKFWLGANLDVRVPQIDESFGRRK